MRHPREYIERRLLGWSVVNVSTPLVEGVHCRDCVRGLKSLKPGHDYGRLWDGERLEYAHRLAFGVWVGPIPEGLDVLHRCDRPRCIEPKHLYAGTHQENLADMVRRGRQGGHKLRGRERGPSAYRGSKHPLSKLTEVQAREIKRWKGKATAVRLAWENGVSDSTVRAIWAGRAWGWL